MNKSNFGFAGVLFAFYLDREKCVFSKIAFQVRSKVHFVRLIFRSRGKFTLVILEFVQFSFLLFFCARIQLKKRDQGQPGQRPSQPAASPASARARRSARPPPPSLQAESQRDSRPVSPPFLVLFSLFCLPPTPSNPPTYINTPQTPPSPHINPKPLSSLAAPHPAPLTRRRRPIAAVRRSLAEVVPRRVSFSPLGSVFLLNRSGSFLTVPVFFRSLFRFSFPKTLDRFSFFFRTVRLNERDHRLFPVNDARSFNRSSLSFRRIYSAIVISDPIFVLVFLLARLSESGDSSAWSFVSKPPFRLINLNKFLPR